jgi:hypothetical protein
VPHYGYVQSADHYSHEALATFEAGVHGPRDAGLGARPNYMAA